jgi:hypothetical protein
MPEIEEDDSSERDDASQLIYQLNEIECRMTDVDENEESNPQTEPSEI